MGPIENKVLIVAGPPVFAGYGCRVEVTVLDTHGFDGLTLRAFRAEDAPAYFEAMQASLEDLRAWIPWVAPDTFEEVRELCKRYEIEFMDGLNFRFGIWQGNRFLGMTCFLLRGTPIDWRIGEIGMWIRTDEAGRGLASKVLNEMIRWGIEDWGWVRLFWKCDTRNVGSMRVAEKCGMTLEGTLRSDCVSPTGERSDSRIYAVIATEPRSR